MSKPHKDEQVLTREESAAYQHRYSKYTVCHCDLGKDHRHFETELEWSKAEVAERMRLFEMGLPVPKVFRRPAYMLNELLPKGEE